MTAPLNFERPTDAVLGRAYQRSAGAGIGAIGAIAVLAVRGLLPFLTVGGELLMQMALYCQHDGTGPDVLAFTLLLLLAG